MTLPKELQELKEHILCEDDVTWEMLDFVRNTTITPKEYLSRQKTVKEMLDEIERKEAE